ncbi:hypothetical protein E8L99_21615 [Phreatobacter aquaticus]|uniref:Polysaccharide pyruvyl transferase family protein n=1 Tax=Phreatobacter aquaticus TaxID=2570229 RepID=A0A4D7QQB6_9HYPH|nr:hypothetical protein [Phreatobacter aquaticus]QCK88173.1 hypothetical protein E8L99_21615 [Phreatobacter aquaticus]
MLAAARDQSDIAFEHRWPALFNLGDYLCSPRHYFKFEPWRDEGGQPRRVTIVGGGAFNQLGQEAGSTGAGRVHIAWGIGRSVAYGNTDVADLGAARAFHSEFSTRDPDLAAQGASLVPCVSVMHELVDLPVGDETGLFLNGDRAVGDSRELRTIAAGKDLVFGTNAMAEHDFMAQLARTNRLITNSYHVAYWGLLSGRAVALIGYSSKFDSLLTLLGLTTKPLCYARGEIEDLKRAVAKSFDQAAFVRLPDHLTLKEDFRQLNRAFARRLVERGLVAAAEPCSSAETLQQRMVMLHERYKTVLQAPI